MAFFNLWNVEFDSPKVLVKLFSLPVYPKVDIYSVLDFKFLLQLSFSSKPVIVFGFK